jgi:hypothetical protein
MTCRSTYDSKPPFRVYIDLEDDPSSAQKVLNQADFLAGLHLQAVLGTCPLDLIVKRNVPLAQAILLIKVRAEYASDKSASSLEVCSQLHAV